MRTHLRLLFVCLIVSLAAPGCGLTPTPRPGAELLAAVDKSFSEIPFGAREAPEGLTIVKRGDCEKWRECTYLGPTGVEHYFWEGELVVKSVQVAPKDHQSISALAIGHSRVFGDVMQRVRAFLPEAEIDCRMQDHGRACSAALGEGWITLRFDHQHLLTEVRIDAHHFT